MFLQILCLFLNWCLFTPDFCWSINIWFITDKYSLYILDFLSNMWFEIGFSHSGACLFTWCQLPHRSFRFLYSPIYFSFCCLYFCLISKKSLIQSHGDWLLLLFFFSVMVLALIFRSVVHFELLFLYDIRYKGPTLFFCYCPCTICWKDNSCSIELSWYPCIDRNSTDHKYTNLFLGSELCCIDVNVFPCTSKRYLITITLY